MAFFKEKKTAFLLILILILGAYLRLSTLNESVVEQPIRGDARSYFFYAVNLQTDGIYSRSGPRVFGAAQPAPDAELVPVYPLFVGLTLSDSWKEMNMAGVEGSIRPTLLLQSLLSLLVIVASFVAGRLMAGNAGGLVAALLAALSPHLVNCSIYLLTESLFTTLFAAAFCLVLAGFSGGPKPRYGLYAAAGLLIGMACLTRQAVQYLPYLLALASIYLARRSWREATVFLAVFLVAMGAWQIRNMSIPATPASFSPMVTTIQHGSYPNLMFNNMPQSAGIPYKFDNELPKAKTLKETLDIIAHRAGQDPLTYLHWYTIGKVSSFFRWKTEPIGSAGNSILTSGDIYLYPTPVTPYADKAAHVASYLFMYLLYTPCLVLALAAAILGWTPLGAPLWGHHALLVRVTGLTLAYATAIHMIGAPFPRYAIPFLPLVYLLAAALLVRLPVLAGEIRGRLAGSGRLA